MTWASKSPPLWTKFGPGKEVLDVLLSIEYIQDDRDPYGPKICPECTYPETDGHYKDCTVGQVLDKYHYDFGGEPQHGNY